MQSIFGIIYLLLFFSYLIVALFIVFHIFRYSLKRGAALFGVTLFSVVFATLLITNYLAFFSLPLDQLLTRSF